MSKRRRTPIDRTPAGTRALVRKYLKAVDEEEFFGLLEMEDEISIRIGKGNSVLIDGKVITAHQIKVSDDRILSCVSISNRIGLDEQDDQMPNPEYLIEGEDEEEETNQESPMI